jgi:mannose-6-phosphate isomerase-like protein (cupin superfamily)
MIKTVVKSWGYEKWLTNNELYCGKILHINKNHCCSYHYHKLKDETFYILSGVVDIEVDNKHIWMKEGTSIRISPHTPHRFFGIEDSDIIEISTQHFDEDSYRIIPTDECYKKVEDYEDNRDSRK